MLPVDDLLPYFDFPINKLLAVAIFAIAVIACIVNLNKGESMNSAGQILLSLFPGAICLVAFILAWREGLLLFALPYKILVGLATILVGFLLFLICIPAKKPVVAKLEHLFRHLGRGFDRPLKWLSGRSSVWRIIIASFFVATLFVILIAFLALRPRPFRVIIKQETPGYEVRDNASFNLESALNGLASQMPDDIEIILDPVDMEADLIITLTQNNSDCNAPYLYNRWQWKATDKLEDVLKLLLVENGKPRIEENESYCRWTRTVKDVGALIRLAHGLNLFYVRRTDTTGAIANFEAAINSMADISSYKSLVDDPRAAEFLALPRRILTCAQVMSVVAQDLPLDEEDRNVLIEVINHDPFGGKVLSPDFCITQAHFWLGRDAMERHLDFLAAGNAATSASFLDDAIEHFSTAAELYGQAKELPNGGPQWIYYFYRAIAHYRQGDFEHAVSDLIKAKKSHADYIVVDLPQSTIDYLCARLWVETSTYPGLVGQACNDEYRKQTDILAPLRQRQDDSVFGIAPLSIGAMSLFNESLYWDALGRCVRDDAQAVSDGSCTDSAAGAEHRNKAISTAERARRRISDDSQDASSIDTYMALLYRLAGRGDVVLSDAALSKYLHNFGAPVYVIPLKPTAASMAHGDVDWPLSFHWLLRNRYDEPVFDAGRLIEETSASNIPCSDIYTFCLRLDDRAGTISDFPLSDRGMGLFVSDEVLMPSMALKASPGVAETIELQGDLGVSLVYRHGEGGPKTIVIGSLPVEVTITNDEFRAEANVHYIGENSDLEADVDCVLCYDYQVVANARFVRDDVNVAKLMVARQDNQPSLTFWADLWEAQFIPSGLSTARCEENWSPTTLISKIRLTPGGQGDLKGRFPIQELDTQKYYSIHVYAEDRNGTRKVDSWDCKISIPIPE